MSILWPTTPEALRAWSEVLLAWVLVTYFFLGNRPIIERVGTHPARAPEPPWRIRAWLRAPVLLLLLLLMLTPRTLGMWTVIIVLPLIATLLPFGRAYLAREDLRWGAELELGAAALVTILSAGLIGDTSALLRGLARTSVPGPHGTVIALAAASLGFLSRGGTHIVRGILARSDSAPLERGSGAGTSPVDVAEYNRGRLIGAIERLIMAVLVAAGAFSALSFLIGAKGLIRSKRLEDHAFGEYFLIGTLASAALAIGCGLVLRAMFATLW